MICDSASRQDIHEIWDNFPILLQTSCMNSGELLTLCSVPTCNRSTSASGLPLPSSGAHFLGAKTKLLCYGKLKIGRSQYRC